MKNTNCISFRFIGRKKKHNTDIKNAKHTNTQTHKHTLARTLAVTSYQATVISPLISVQIKGRSVAAEPCWLITGPCKGFGSLSAAPGPHLRSGGSSDQGHGRPERLRR